MEDGKINDGQKKHVLNDCKHTTESFESVINMQCIDIISVFLDYIHVCLAAAACAKARWD